MQIINLFWVIKIKWIKSEFIIKSSQQQKFDQDLRIESDDSNFKS